MYCNFIIKVVDFIFPVRAGRPNLQKESVNVFNRNIVKFRVGCKLFVPALKYPVGLRYIKIFVSCP